jgi:uncharacterized pyridoxamine 5'-phosphate oxidase family protein
MDHYTYTVKWCRKAKQFIGTCAEFPKISFYDADRDRAMVGVQNLVANVSRDDEMKELLINTVPQNKQTLLESN